MVNSRIDIYDSGQLGDEKQSFDYTRQGVICLFSAQLCGQKFLKCVPDFPFLFKDVPHARKIYQGEIGKELHQVLNHHNQLSFSLDA